MTSGQFSEVDLDLLADYVGGALEGAEEAEVERLVREDPSWSEAYARLAPAMDAVRGELAAWGGARLTMPADVTDRLAAALAGAPQPPRADADPTSVVPAEQLSTTQRPAGGPGRRTGVPGQRADGAARRVDERIRETGATAASGGRPAPAGPDRAGRRSAGRGRWSRAAGPVAVAALVVALAGLGIGQLVPGGGFGTNDAGRIAAARPDASTTGAGPARAVREPSAQRPVRSGTDYDAASLGTALALVAGTGAAAPAVPPASGQPGPTTGKTGLAPQNAPQAGRSTIPAELARLADPAALDACLDAVAAEHAAGTTAVRMVDFATYEGTPALAVLFTDGTGARWAWVAGPACGLPGSGADTRQQTRVG